jgi:hypothetical protein
LNCLHGVRFLSICWIVAGHRFMSSLNVPSINTVDAYVVSSFCQFKEGFKCIPVCGCSRLCKLQYYI